ncbi:MAG: flagellar biosynthetic protein FliR [Chloroflexi bacterium]|nr:flagellar biosynthetic protein FliR [Chloroflexota bacterium]
MFDLANWMLVFLRASAMLAIFPVFSAPRFPVQLRLALGALLAYLMAPQLPAHRLINCSLWSLIGQMMLEIVIGLVLGFACRMIFYALDLAGGIIAAEMGLSLPSLLNPMETNEVTTPALILHTMAAVLWLSMDMHHWMLIGFQQTYALLPVGGSHLQERLFLDIVARSGKMFLVALQMTAPVIAVSFIITLVFAVLGRAVPQMNVFAESFAVRILAGLAAFGLTLHLMAQHVLNYLRRIPEDIVHVARLLGTG